MVAPGVEPGDGGLTDRAPCRSGSPTKKRTAKGPAGTTPVLRTTRRDGGRLPFDRRVGGERDVGAAHRQVREARRAHGAGRASAALLSSRRSRSRSKGSTRTTRGTSSPGRVRAPGEGGCPRSGRPARRCRSAPARVRSRAFASWTGIERHVDRPAVADLDGDGDRLADSTSGRGERGRRPAPGRASARRARADAGGVVGLVVLGDRVRRDRPRARASARPGS